MSAPSRTPGEVLVALAVLVLAGNLALLVLVATRQVDVQRRARSAALLLEFWQVREQREPQPPPPRVQGVSSSEPGSSTVQLNKTSHATCRTVAQQLRQLDLDQATTREILLENGCRDKARE